MKDEYMGREKTQHTSSPAAHRAPVGLVLAWGSMIIYDPKSRIHHKRNKFVSKVQTCSSTENSIWKNVSMHELSSDSGMIEPHPQL